jgi:hypothetical protein
VTPINLSHYLLGPPDRIGDGADGRRNLFSAIVLGELSGSKNRCHDTNHSLATFIHEDILALSCFVRLVIPSLEEITVWNFIDDSGSFSWGHNKGKSLFCGVTVSDVELPNLEKRFVMWKRSIVGDSAEELKGSQLTANQLVSFVVKVLPPYSNVVLTVGGGDTSVTAEGHVEKMRDQSAELFRLSSDLCAKHTSETNRNEKVVEFYRQMSGWVRKRSTPNCLWIVVLLQTIFDTLQHAIVRFAEPEFSSEFENIEFVIDKSFIQRDEHFQFWKEWLRADLMKSSRESIMTIKQWPSDHPYKKKYMMHKGLYDYRDLFHNHTAFQDSKGMVGLQVADVCANICYRFYRDDRKDIRAYEKLWRRIMCKGGAEIRVITVDERSLHKGDLSELLGVLDMDEYKRLGEEKDKAVNAEREYE